MSMQFQLRPILSEMKALYLKPISADRFKEYLFKLQGTTKGDLILPISGFNPMAKEHILQKIEELENIEAESLMEEVIDAFNSSIKDKNSTTIKVILNVADDLKGAWTSFDSTDFDSKFKLSALIKRNFCSPYFWTSESYTKEIIRLRTKEYLSRTLWGMRNSKPKTLAEHVDQEVFVAQKTIDKNTVLDKASFPVMEPYFLENQKSEEYDLIFNFFYGDAASERLGYKKYGIKDKSGFDYAKFIALRNA